MKILLSGGGSMGSVSPLLAVQNYTQQNHSDKNPEFFWLISTKGPEDKILREKNIKYKKIISARLKRGFNLSLLWQLIKLELAFWQSLFFLTKHRPNIVVSTGSYVSPPTIWAAWLLRIPSLIHQQDVRPGLANKIMAPFAKKITVCFEETVRLGFKTQLNNKKFSVVGNPVRQEIKQASELSEAEVGERLKKAKKYFKLENNLPTLLIVSGSQGAIVINEVTTQALPQLLEFCQVIHITGKREIKSAICNLRSAIKNRYHRFEFLTDKMIDALLIADLIISRAGMNLITEMSYLKKACLLIPVYNSHQEDNVDYLKRKDAAKVLSFKDKGGNIKKQSSEFVEKIKYLIYNQNKLNQLKQNISQIIPKKSEVKIAQHILNFSLW